HWPGNVRELENVVERAVILSDGEQLTVQQLPPHFTLNSPSVSSLYDIPDEGVELVQIEKNLIRKALEKTNGNKSRAAKLLGITRRRLYSMMERLELI
ncbi:MAG TPA: hypothetical protein ENG82_01200, partial [Bacteroidetes bacterium]|nr:hypothetical protein [Bacteroidota bacterium]